MLNYTLVTEEIDISKLSIDVVRYSVKLDSHDDGCQQRQGHVNIFCGASILSWIFQVR